MSPPAGVNAQLRQLIHYHLDNGFLENALFLAGRLQALEPRNADAAHLLALCNLRLGRYKAAFDLSKSKALQAQHLGCAYIFAQTCLALERFDLGVQALEKARGLWVGRNHWNKHSETSRRHVPDAAACFCLLGKLHAANDDLKKAIESYVESLKLNPFMWDAFTGLCDIGAVVRPQNIFKVTPDILASITHANINGSANHINPSHDEAKNPFVSAPDNDPFNPTSRTGGEVALKLAGSNLLSRLNGNHQAVNGDRGMYHDIATPITNGHQGYNDEDIMMGEAGGPVMNEQNPDGLQAPARKTRLNFNATEEPPKMRPITSRLRTKTNPEADQTDIPRPIHQNGHKRTVSGHATQHTQVAHTQAADPTAAPPRRSVRLLNSVTSFRTGSRAANAAGKAEESKDRRELRKVKATGTKGKIGIVGREVSGNRKPPVEISETTKAESRPASAAALVAPPPRMAPPVDTAREQEAISWLLELLLKIGSGYRHLCRYELVKALESFANVPTAQRETAWVLSQMGKAYYEQGQYVRAEEIFERIREKAPSFLDNMEVYSNTLWQLKKEVALSHLAHQLMEQDRLSPQAWCALGNACSLNRQHDEAVKCFNRATQLDPRFAYAFTLQGHEHVSNEEFDKAMMAYRHAIGADNRHYNGWYGLGNVYERLGKYELAEKHYRAAALINQSNAMLLVRIGAVLDRQKKVEPALMQYDAACKIDPRSVMARFRKAQMLLKLGSAAEARHDLEFLKDVAPQDPNVHFLLGRCYKKLNDRASAIRHLTIAMNLDPKSHGVIKEVMESIDQDDDGGWSSEDDH